MLSRERDKRWLREDAHEDTPGRYLRNKRDEMSSFSCYYNIGEQYMKDWKNVSLEERIVYWISCLSIKKILIIHVHFLKIIHSWNFIKYINY